ncbi:sugar ABC transporter [Mycolicibacterium wolinskyi]|uniref:Sugar ABC transporter n=1 Tax=Mycolicibacterium wolinskyi TaxID=59750 RepID=A0A132PK58_9MYCO|nr:sugar ABC transporter [Mycolicibacterium wolinskyi]
MTNVAQPIAELDGIAKSYNANTVLRDVSLKLLPGRVHVLAGENGAGKSTLIKILSGAQRNDSGRVLIDGQPVELAGPRDARARGVAVVHQELSLVPELTVADNIVLGREPRRRGARLDRRRATGDATAALALIGANIDSGARVATLTSGEQQLVEIARALAEQPRLLILDEPTAALSQREADRLLQIVAELRDSGLAILYISHRMEEIARIADEVTVLRDGTVTDHMLADEMTEDRIVTSMVGRPVQNLFSQATAADPDNVRLQVRGLCSASIGAADFDVHRGEVLGLAGIVGAGRSELCRLIAGVDRAAGGSVTVDGEIVELRGIAGAASAGIAMLPESRKTQGLFLDMSIADNVCLGTACGRERFGRTTRASRRRGAKPLTDAMRVKSTDLDQPVGQLSGGNQQKVLLARCLAKQPKVLILDEPTRGVDVGAKADIYALIEQVARAGVAIVLVSSELPELLGLADRVLVMRQGRVVAELSGAEANEHNVIRHATGSVAKPLEVQS